MISVPAYQGLFTAHDTWLGHFRRYSPGEGRKLIQESGFQLLEDGSFFHTLLYARAFAKLKEKIAGHSEQKGVGGWSKGPVITGAIHRTLNLDWKFGRGLRRIGVRLPGLSWWCICRKP